MCQRERERESLGRDGAASSVKTQAQTVCLDVQAAAEEQNNQQLSEVEAPQPPAFRVPSAS